MKRAQLLASMIMLAFAATTMGCATHARNAPEEVTPTASEPADLPLTGTTWLGTPSMAQGDAPRLVIQAMTWTGSDGCNDIGGTTELTESTIRLRAVGSSGKACPAQRDAALVALLDGRPLLASVIGQTLSLRATDGSAATVSLHAATS